MLQHIESAILVILALTMGGYSPWVSATREATDLADANRGAGSAAIAVAPVPPQTPVAALGAKPSPQNTPARESSMVAPAASKTAPASTAGAGQSSVEPEPAPLPAPVAEVWAEVIPTSLEYSPELIEYFTEIGLNGEYGSASPGLRHWTEDIRIQVHGTPSGADIRTLHQVVEGLNRLVTGVELQIVGGNGNVDLHFAPEGRFADQEPAYVPVNLGFFRVWWDRGGAIYRARILIASQGITQQERDHLIREELTQSLGLFNDSRRYPDSIFYQGWTDTTRYTDLEEAAIRLLYAPSLRAGMSKGEVLDALDAPPRPAASTSAGVSPLRNPPAPCILSLKNLLRVAGEASLQPVGNTGDRLACPNHLSARPPASPAAWPASCWTTAPTILCPPRWWSAPRR